MTKNYQKGFGIIPVLLVLILVSLVGLTGYYVYNTQQPKKTNDSAVSADTAKQDSSNSAATQATTTAAAQTETKPADTQKYLVIKEWGVKIPLSSGIEDLTYQYTSYSDYALGGYARLGTQKLLDMKCGDGINGSIVRSPKESSTSGISLGKINNNYYYFTHAQSACMSSTGPNDPKLQVQVATDKELEVAVKQIQSE